MQYEAKNPKEYLNKLENDWRKDKLQEVRRMIQSIGTELIEGIEYKMLCYGDQTKNIFHLNAQRGYVSLYVGNIDKIENARELLSEFNLGKGCIRIKKSNELSTTKLNEFIMEVVKVWQKGGDIGC